MSTIVLGYDGSPSANAALEHVLSLAPRLGATVHVVFGYYISPLGGGDARDYHDALVKLGQHELARAHADLDAAGIDTHAHLRSGKPAEVILELAEEVDADYVVVGTRGESPISGAVLGSVVLRLIQRCRRPMLVVPGGDA